MAELDLVVTSGGLGPTADDMTAEVVAEFSGRPLALDEALEERIWKILERLRSRWRNLDEDAIRASNRKQALVPDGATVLEPVGTAPGSGASRGRRRCSCSRGRRASCSRCGRRRWRRR